MKHLGNVGVALAAIVLNPATRAQQLVTLNVVTAGDQNMVDYAKDYLLPMFEKEHPGVRVKAVGTGPGDAGSQKILEKIEAQKSNPAWDIDVQRNRLLRPRGEAHHNRRQRNTDGAGMFHNCLPSTHCVYGAE